MSDAECNNTTQPFNSTITHTPLFNSTITYTHKKATNTQPEVKGTLARDTQVKL